MAWNPGPEVQVARDAAKAMSATLKGAKVNRCIVLFTTDDGQLGYASYGETSALCTSARELGDAAFDAVLAEWEASCG